MSTMTLRTVSPGDQHAQASIKVNSEPYNTGNPLRKWGLIKLVISSIVISRTGTTGSTQGGVLDVRVPRFNDACDTPIKDNVSINQNAVTTLNLTNDDGTYVFAVNDGVPGPCVWQHEDGTWSLMEIRFDMLDGVDGTYAVTVNYTLAYTDLTPSVLPTP
jgi:hypothetical protein